MRSPTRRAMNSRATALQAVSRSTGWLFSTKSLSCMLSDRSTASIRSRPLSGISTGSPSHSGRAALVSSSSQMQAASSTLVRAAWPLPPPASSTSKSRSSGTRRAAPCAGVAGLSKRRSSHGSGSSANIQGQSNCSMGGGGHLLARQAQTFEPGAERGGRIAVALSGDSRSGGGRVGSAAEQRLQLARQRAGAER